MAKEKIKEILGGIITHLSLCPAGANNIATVYKSDDGKESRVEISVLSKAMTELGEIASLVYVPNAVDSQNDFATAKAIKDLAYSFAQKGKGIDIIHNEEVLPKDAAFVAESYIVQKGDLRFADAKDYGGSPVNATGGWAVVVKVNDPKLRELYRSGQWQGISMGGFVSKRDSDSGPSGAFKTKPSLTGEDTEMTAEELKALGLTLTEANGVMAKSIVDGIAKALNPEKKTDEQTPEQIAKDDAKSRFMAQFPVPMMPDNPNEAQMELFQKAAQVIDLARTVDPTDLNSVFQFHQMRKAIMEGKEGTVTTMIKSDPWGFHLLSNQSTEEIAKANAKGNVELTDSTISMTAKASDVLSDKEIEGLLAAVGTGMPEDAKVKV